MDIDDALRRNREKRRALKLKIYTIDGEGASNSPKDWAKREAAAKELEKLTADLRRLKKQKQKGAGHKTRRR
jgi:hypothetical protein